MTIIIGHEDGEDDGCEKSKDDYYYGLLLTIIGCPRKSTFLKFQVYKSIFSTTLDPSNGLYWAIWIIWTAMDCWTISYNFVCLVGP